MDDLSVTDGYCETSPYFCDFEKDTCGFNFETTGRFNWTRRVGKATTALTGPSVDHTVILNFIQMKKIIQLSFF